MSPPSVGWRVWLLTALAPLGAGGAARAQDQADPAVTLRGMVLDTALRPLPDALVYLASARLFGVSDDAGRFTLVGIEKRRDTLEFRGLGFMPRAFRMDLREADRDTIDLGPVVLEPGPAPTMRLTVSVQDTLRNGGVGGANVLVNDRSVGETDTAGVYTGTLSVNWGINVVLVRRLGYAPLFSSVWVGEYGARQSLTGIMQPRAIELSEVVVEGDRIRFSFAGPEEFWRRRRFGSGRFFTRTDIERRRPTRVTDMLLAIPFLWISRDGRTTRIQAMLQGQRCNVSVWLNGSPLRDGGDIDTFVHPRDVRALEVYRGWEIPPQYGAFNGCGAVLIWTW